MERVAVPTDLTSALLAAGYRIGGPAGVGGGGPVWTATRPVPGGGAPERVVVQRVEVPDGEPGQALADRLRALCAVDHPHLAPVADVLDLPPSAAGRPRAWAVLLAEIPGATVAALLAARGRLSAGEVVTLTVPVAGALDALHRLGLVHGDVSPANIVVRPDGRPVLIDLLGALAAPGDDAVVRRGTPGFVAPEVAAARGRRPAARGTHGSASPTQGGGRAASRAVDGGPADGPGDATAALPARAPADVFSLAAVALAALDLGAVDGPLGDELAAACAPEPLRRPTAAELAPACYRCATPEPIRLPDAGVLARTSLAQLAAEPRTVSGGTRSRHRARRTGGRRVRGGALFAGGVAAALACVLTFVAVARDAPAAAPGADGGAGSAQARVVGVDQRPDPVDAAVDLTRQRAEVLAAGDPDALGEVVRPGSGAHAADLELLAGLAAARVRLEGLAAVVDGAELAPASGDVSPGAAGPAGVAPAVLRPDTVDVVVRSGITAHRRVGDAGTVEVPAQPVRAVVLRLVWTGAGWRVEDVRPG